MHVKRAGRVNVPDIAKLFPVVFDLNEDMLFDLTNGPGFLPFTIN